MSYHRITRVVQWSASTHRAAAYAAAAVLLVQCALVPMALGHARPSPIALSAMAATAIAMFMSIRGLGPRSPRSLAVALALAPALLAMTSIMTTAAARFDPLARIVAALTAIAYFVAVLALYEASAPRVTVTTRRTKASGAPPPPLRWVAWICLIVGAASLALIGPAWLAARPLTAAERALGPGFGGAREAIVSAAGLLCALVWTLSAGPKLLRGKSAGASRRARAIAMLVWSFAFGALWWWVERAR